MNNESKQKKETRDIRIVFLVFAVIFLLLAFRLRPGMISVVLAVLAALLLVLLTAAPRLLRPLFAAWMKVAHILGRVNTQVLLFLVYILVFVPTALVLRLAGKDLLQQKRIADKSYWEPYETAGLKDRSRYERQF